ncbi:MAG: type II toxin-antitoxin system RatA family toxin [Bdellovibrionales bacterium]
MAKASASDVFNCSVEEFYKIVADYEKYPDFLDEVKSCRIVEDQGSKKLVEYTVSVIKNFSYSLWLTETENKGVRWEFAGGDIFKTNNGSWLLTDEAGKCRATYDVEAKFGIFVPGPVTKALVNVNLPTMMSAFAKRVNEVYGK